MKSALMIMALCFAVLGVVDSRTTLANTNEIEGIYLRTEARYGLAGVYVENESYLLLKDGSIFTGLSDNPYTLEVKLSRKKEANSWGKWRRKGKKLIVTWANGETEEWTKWFVTEGAEPNERISGAFRSSDPFTGANAFNMNTLIMTMNGDYYWLNQKGGMTNWRSIIAEREKSGVYRLEDHSITFIDNDGSNESYLFYFYPGKRDTFGIGPHHFLPFEKKR